MISLKVPFGIGIAVAVRVGNMLGAGNPDKAKKATMVALCFTSKHIYSS